MPKAITSPVKRWSGTVTLSDPLTFPQAIAFEEALDSIKTLGKDASIAKYYAAILPGVLACVDDWDLADFPDNPAVDNFPATPRVASIKLLDWLIDEITHLYNDAEPDPNE